MPKKPKRIPLFDVQLRDAKPNHMFKEWQTAITKFLHFTQPVKCAYCGFPRRKHRTQLRFFRIAEGFEKKLPSGKVVKCFAVVASMGKEIFPPLTPVCGSHILAPIVPK